MNPDIRKEALRQYLRYFRWWFLGLGILLAAYMIVFGIRKITDQGAEEQPVRGNTQAPAERVYDYAEVLSDEEEASLRDMIAAAEPQIQCDIVLVTIKEVMGESDYEWETNMRNYADDFYDQAGYGYDKVHGDGVLLLDNWYTGQGGSWLSTCGRVYEAFGTSDIEDVLYDVKEYVETDPYKAYAAYIRTVTRKMTFYNDGGIRNIPLWCVWVIPAAAAVIFLIFNSRAPEGVNTVTPGTYVEKDSMSIRKKEDVLVNKFVTTRHIPRNTGGGSGGRGGGHISSGGVSHGGGGMRR